MHFFSRYTNQLTHLFRIGLNRLKSSRIYTRLISKFCFFDNRKSHQSIVPTALFDGRRRTFVRYALFGGAVFLVGKYLAPAINMLRGDTILNEKSFDNFRLTETGKQLRVTDDSGNEILIIDKESF